MLNISVTDQELNTIIHGLYTLEDQVWFSDYELTEPLIQKLSEILPKDDEPTDWPCFSTVSDGRSMRLRWMT